MYPKRKKLQKPLRSTLRWCSYDIWSIESAGFTSKYILKEYLPLHLFT